ncbi:MAG: hypothetical protein Q8Q73_03655 [Stagnimonas sp.]|nr:hypothetical protein [Stagnimonas sp.]
MARRVLGGGGDIAPEAARIFVEESLTDYGQAKRRAAERLGLPTRAALPDNARVEAEVLAYQRLFGGADYVARLQLLRRTAVQAMKLLARFEPRLSGAVVTGAISDAHRVQLHCFPDQPELVDVFLAERGFEVELDERDYRFGDGRSESVPLACFQADRVGVDVALFAPEQQRRAPLSQTSGRPAPRLSLAEAEQLAAASIDSLF